MRGRYGLAMLLPAVALAVSACGSDDGGAAPPASAADAIRLDQLGYLPDETKIALATGAEGASEFLVKSANGATVLRGTLEPARTDPDSGDTVRAADLSRVTQEGTYRIEVPGVGASHEFEVSPRLYANAFRLAMRSFYGQRCGTAVDLAPTHPGYAHAACHTSGTPNPDARFHTSSGRDGSRESGRGWHDAGDYGKYVVNSGITTGELLWAYELYRDRIAGVRLDIPESGNAVPDILD